MPSCTILGTAVFFFAVSLTLHAGESKTINALACPKNGDRPANLALDTVTRAEAQSDCLNRHPSRGFAFAKRGDKVQPTRRARQRHFNPKAAGATAAFDARYGIAVADGAGVDTWTNRVGSNNATQTTSGNRPIFRATGGKNNSPALEFDGINDQLNHSISITIAPNLIMAVAMRTGGVDYSGIAAFMPANTANFNIIYARFGGANWGFAPGNSGQSILNAWRICSAKPAGTATTNSPTTMWTDGANETTATGSRYGGDANDRRQIGSVLAQDYFGGSLSQVIAIPADVGNPLRKRLEHAAAYSFKISCN